MKTRRLGSHGPEVSALGLGCMGMSDLYGPADRAESIATIHAALDAGVSLARHRRLLRDGAQRAADPRRARRARPRRACRSPSSSARSAGPTTAWLGYDARPAAVKTALAYTLKRLDTDHVDVYRPARLDPAVPIEETIGAIAELVEAGYVRHIGLSELGAETIRRAAAVHPITDLQIEYSLISRSLEAEILPVCRELGIAVTAYGVLSRGLLSGHWSAERDLAGGDFRALSPRFQGENLERNLALVEALRGVAEERDAHRRPGGRSPGC